MSIKDDFQKIYPFTTECISGYIQHLKLKDKKVITVGSSCDQAFNSLLMGASEVTVFDINEKVEEFYHFKRKLILDTPREQLVEKVINSKEFSYFDDIFTKNQLEKMNIYLRDEQSYHRLRRLLDERPIKFITGNIFDIENCLDGNIYDRVILSNALQYIIETDTPIEKVIYDIYCKWCSYLSEEAIIQFYYLYGSMYPNKFTKIINEFAKNGILFEKISCDEKDSIVVVKKKTY